METSLKYRKKLSESFVRYVIILFGLRAETLSGKQSGYNEILLPIGWTNDKGVGWFSTDHRTVYRRPHYTTVWHTGPPKGWEWVKSQKMSTTLGWNRMRTGDSIFWLRNKMFWIQRRANALYDQECVDQRVDFHKQLYLIIFIKERHFRKIISVW